MSVQEQYSVQPIAWLSPDVHIDMEISFHGKNVLSVFKE